VECQDRFVAGSDVEVKMTSGACSALPDDIVPNSWLVGKIVRLEGAQYEVQFSPGRTAWFHSHLKELRLVRARSLIESHSLTPLDFFFGFWHHFVFLSSLAAFIVALSFPPLRIFGWDFVSTGRCGCAFVR
jgi:hypothetical protein